MKRLIVLVTGINILGLGTAVCNFTGLGIDPINAFAVAVSDLMNVQLGMFLLVLQFLLGIGVFIFKRENIGVGTIVPMITFGYFLQFFNWLIPQFVSNSNSLIVNSIIFIFGMLIIAFGMSMYMSCKVGMVPYDSVAFILSERIGKNPAVFRIAIDAIVAVIAFFLGGPINIGTVLLAVSIGPLIDFYRRKVFHKMFIV